MPPISPEETWMFWLLIAALRSLMVRP